MTVATERLLATPADSSAAVARRPTTLGTLLRRNPRLVVGGGLVTVLVLIAVFAPLLTRYDPTLGDVADGLLAPSAAHWLGTDDQGRDMFARVLYGARISLSVAVISVSIGLFTGVSVGVIAGYVGGLTDLLLMRVIDALLAFPALLLAISISAALGPQIQNAMIAIGVVAIPVYARLTRAQVLSLREREFVTAARAVGVRPSRIVLRHFAAKSGQSADCAGHPHHGGGDSAGSCAVIPGAWRAAAHAIVGDRYQLQPAVHHQLDVVGECGARGFDLPGGLCLQLPG